MPSPVPVLAITMGDAAGVGPELIAKVLAGRTDGSLYRPLLVGDPETFARGATDAGVKLRFRPIASLAEAVFDPAEPEVIVPDGIDVESVLIGAVDPRAGAAAAASLRTAYELVARGEVSAVVSAPLNKAALHAAGYDYADEVAYLAAETGSSEPALVGIVRDVCTVSVTLHVPLRAVPDLLTRERVIQYVRILDDTLRRLGRDRRLAIAALNPHAGESGLLGREEIDVLGPAADDARARGVDVVGPLPADTIFVRALAGEFDGVVCLYHDQANIARKLSGFGAGASIFLGLPAVFATTAHGTAYDIAGTGNADPSSLLCAIKASTALAINGASTGD